MKKLILFLFITPLLCLTACEPQAINPTFLNGTWEREGIPYCACQKKWSLTFKDGKLLTNHWWFTRTGWYGGEYKCIDKENELFFWNYKLDATKTYRWNFRYVDKNVSLDTIPSVPFDPHINFNDYEIFNLKKEGDTLYLRMVSGETESQDVKKFYKIKN